MTMTIAEFMTVFNKHGLPNPTPAEVMDAWVSALAAARSMEIINEQQMETLTEISGSYLRRALLTRKANGVKDETVI